MACSRSIVEGVFWVLRRAGERDGLGVAAGGGGLRLIMVRGAESK
jgi:hypothetical protein